jgi:hypothetical protein
MKKSRQGLPESPERNPPTFEKKFEDFLRAFQKKNIFFEATLSRKKKYFLRCYKK